MGILFGYIFAFLGGIIGIFIGRFIATHKKTLPNGEKVFAYCAPDRNHGNRIVSNRNYSYNLLAHCYAC
jgi:hypothetical protein